MDEKELISEAQRSGVNQFKSQLALEERRRFTIDSMQNEIDQFVNKLFKININIREILNLYGQIDAFSQGKFSEKTSPFTARNMGKNDLWIAATASAYDMTLITTDKDFNHLNGEFFEVKYVDLELFKK